MDKLLALIALFASLFGCDGGRDTIVHRVTDAGIDLLSSRVTIQGGSTRFDCVRSASGTCHYLVLPRDCADAVRCGSRAQRFDVTVGASRSLVAVQAFRLCVDHAAGMPSPQCTASNAPDLLP